MTLKVTERDKKLLVFLAIFVVSGLGSRRDTSLAL